MININKNLVHYVLKEIYTKTEDALNSIMYLYNILINEMKKDKENINLILEESNNIEELLKDIKTILEDISKLRKDINKEEQ